MFQDSHKLWSHAKRRSKNTIGPELFKKNYSICVVGISIINNAISYYGKKKISERVLRGKGETISKFLKNSAKTSQYYIQYFVLKTNYYFLISFFLYSRNHDTHCTIIWFNVCRTCKYKIRFFCSFIIHQWTRNCRNSQCGPKSGKR